jgi:predicted GIY-YIG superfamily endonuclease
MISYLEAKPFSIYLVLNTVNGKVYVGKTERRLNKRWTEHKGRTSRKRAEREALRAATTA